MTCAVGPSKSMMFVVGPSRAGKTTLLRLVLPEFPGLTLLDLDAEEKRIEGDIRSRGGHAGGWNERWLRDCECIQAAVSARREVVVDVGAGSLQTSEGRLFFTVRGASAIAVVAPLESVLARHHGRDREEFRSTEYSEERQRVYDAAKFQVNGASALEQSVAEFHAALRALVETRRSS